MSNLKLKKMTKFKNVFLLAAMAVSAVFVACDKEDKEESLQGTTLTLTKDGVTTTVSFTSATELTAVVAGGASQNGSYTFVGSTLTLTFDGKTITLTKSNDGTFTGGGYTVTSGGDDPAGGDDPDGGDPDGGDDPDDWDGKIVAVVSTGGVPVDEVLPTGGTGNRNLSTTAKYENDTLTIELLDPVPDSYLELLSGFDPDAPNAPNVQGTWLHSGIDANYGGWTGNEFRHSNADAGALYIYLKTEGEALFGISLKKGWNRIFIDRTTMKPTTTDPGWVFKEYNP
ncbi:hypothetical protein AGMMS49982_17910 [Bacteroidia bacterium]|nr:hypothetical protein AGMMS49982_17910 [Bacteroidia bacterium]